MAKTEVTLTLTPDEHRLVRSAVEEAILLAHNAVQEARDSRSVEHETVREAKLTFLLEKL